MYASQPGSPPNHATLGSGGWLVLTGTGLAPAGFQQEVSILVLSFTQIFSSSKLGLAHFQRKCCGPRRSQIQSLYHWLLRFPCRYGRAPGSGHRCELFLTLINSPLPSSPMHLHDAGKLVLSRVLVRPPVVGWPRAVTHPGLPQIRTCGTPASGSSDQRFAAPR